MFADDIRLVEEMTTKYGRPPGPYVDCGGLEAPTIADYARTIALMRGLADDPAVTAMRIGNAQTARYLRINRPLDRALPGYVCENPETGGLVLADLHTKYGSAFPGIGVATVLSVLEHVDNPFRAVESLWDAMADGGLVIVSVPWEFPHHPGGGEDNWRFSPSGLMHVFTGTAAIWEILECDWRLNITADQGVLDIKTGKPQAIRSAYLVARAA